MFDNSAMRALLTDSVLVRCHVGYERGTVTLSADDFGLSDMSPESAEFVREYLSLGTIRVVDAKKTAKLNSLEIQFRTAVRTWGIHSGAFNGVIVKTANMTKLMDKLDALKSEAHGILETAVSEWSVDREVILADMRKLGRIRLLISRGVKPEQFDSAMLTSTEQERISMFVDRIGQRMPTVEQMRSRFRFDYLVTPIHMPDGYSDAMQSEIDRLTAELESATSTTEYATKQQALEIARDIQTRNAEVAKAIFESEIAETLKAASARIRDEIYTTACELRDAMNKAGKVLPRHGEKLRALVEYCKAISIGDDSLVGQLDLLFPAEVTNASVSMAEMQSAISKAAIAARVELLDIGHVSRATRNGMQEFEIPSESESAEIPATEKRRVKRGHVQSTPGMVDLLMVDVDAVPATPEKRRVKRVSE